LSFADDGERTIAFGAMSVVIGLANVAGLILGESSSQTDLFGLAWRAIFLVNLPVGIAAILLTPLVLADVRSGEHKRLDLAGVALSTLAMLLLMLPLVAGPERGWTGWPVAMLIASPLAFLGFYRHQRRKSRRGLSPLLETDLFGDHAFNVGRLLILIFWGSTTPFSFSYMLLMQTGYGYSPLATAASLAILGGAFGIVSPIAGRLASFGVRRNHDGRRPRGLGRDASCASPVLDGRSASGRMASYVPVARWRRYGSLYGANTERGDERHPRPPRRICICGPDDDAAGRHALGMAALEVPFFLTLSGAGSRGLSQTASYV
jgi:MFS family permease